MRADNASNSKFLPQIFFIRVTGYNKRYINRCKNDFFLEMKAGALSLGAFRSRHGNAGFIETIS